MLLDAVLLDVVAVLLAVVVLQQEPRVCVYLELLVEPEVDVDVQQPAVAVQEHDVVVVVVEVEAVLADTHELALRSDSHTDKHSEWDCIEDNP